MPVPAMTDDSRLKREIQPMPDDVHEALLRLGLMTAYEARPAYQRNDYLGWLAGAKRLVTRQKRLEQMLQELSTGGVYMNMRHRPSAR
jgi:uncharacterized protein YdeI (YjbR/CyaY-like superfamily)